MPVLIWNVYTNDVTVDICILKRGIGPLGEVRKNRWLDTGRRFLSLLSKLRHQEQITKIQTKRLDFEFQKHWNTKSKHENLYNLKASSKG